jgi:hypothetical protein
VAAEEELIWIRATPARIPACDCANAGAELKSKTAVIHESRRGMSLQLHG